MAHEIPWNKLILETFIDLAALSKEEEWVMRTRVAGWPRTRQAMELHISVETLDRIIRRLKRKYDAVQQQSPLLPPRKKSSEELWMDTH